MAIPHSRPWIDASDREAVDRALSTGMLARGAEVAAFERELGEYLGMHPGIATSSGTGALSHALRALGVGAGHDVVIPTYVCAAVRNAVVATGASARLCDVGDHWCVTAASVQAAMTPRTRAVVVVHTFGIRVDDNVARRSAVPVVDDCCQAIGPSPTSGAVCVVSFHATKMLATGEGGMALTRDRALADRMRALAADDRDQLSDLQAALGRSQLRRYPAFLSRRRELAERYCRALAGLPVVVPAELITRSLFFRFPLRTTGDFDLLREEFAAHGIHVRRGVDTLLHRSAGLDASLFPNAERLFRETLSIPLYPALTDDDASRVIAAAEKVLLPLAAA